MMMRPEIAAIPIGRARRPKLPFAFRASSRLYRPISGPRSDPPECNRISRHAPEASATIADPSCAASTAKRPLCSAMKLSRSQRLAASTVAIPASLNSFGNRSCSVWNTRSDRPRACRCLARFRFRSSRQQSDRGTGIRPDSGGRRTAIRWSGRWFGGGSRCGHGLHRWSHTVPLTSTSIPNCRS
jgi:hypothetical protein